MADQGMVEVVLESAIKRSEKKIVNPTKALVTNLLEEAGLDGVWSVRDSRRIKKKGRERFGTIRIESRAGSTSIRFWCKPRGNDTAFEYSLFPPADVDIQTAFAILKRVSPITLRVAESPSLPTAVLARALNIDNPIPMEQERIVEVSDEGRTAEENAPSELAGDERDLSLAEKVEIQEGDVLGAKTPADSESEVVLDDSAEDDGDFNPLELDPSFLLSDHEAMDRAIVAMSFVAQLGYAKKSEASSSIVRHLGIKRFVSSQSTLYKSVQGAMRALTMALRKRGKYIKRIRYESARGGGVSRGIRGYKFTSAGVRRLELVKGRFGPSVEAMVNANWAVESEGLPTVADKRDEAVSPKEASAACSPKSISKVKELVSSYELAEKQVREVDEVISSAEEEIAKLKLDLQALEIAEREKKRQMDALRDEVERMLMRRQEVSEKLAQKESERKEWEEMKRPHKMEVDRINGLLSSLEGGK
jgi:hypothetical protein